LKEKKTEYFDIMSKMADVVSDEIPYFNTAKKAYNFAQMKRISRFLKSINYAVSLLTEQDKGKFEKYINSEVGYDFLAEYSDSVLKTSSKIAISALGILFADSDNLYYSEQFKRIACYMLQGTTDDLIEVFLIMSNLPTTRKGRPYWLCELDGNSYEQNDELRAATRSAEDLFAYISEFTRRGMFLPDHTPSRLSGGTWFVVFGITEITTQIRDLLIKAQKLISKENSK